MNDIKYTSWTEDELRLVHTYKERILQEGGGNGISKKSPSLIELQSLCKNRTPQAVHNKVRTTLISEGSLITRKQMMARIKSKALHEEVTAMRLDVANAPSEERNTIFDYTPPADDGPIEIKLPASKVVSVPLNKLYGKVDYETFMSLINE